MKPRGALRRIISLLAGVAAGITGGLIVAVPASAHYSTVQGVARCDGTTGTWVIQWTVRSKAPMESTTWWVKQARATHWADGTLVEGASPVPLKRPVPIDWAIPGTDRIPGHAQWAKLEIRAAWDDGVREEQPSTGKVHFTEACAVAGSATPSGSPPANSDPPSSPSASPEPASDPSDPPAAPSPSPEPSNPGPSNPPASPTPSPSPEPSDPNDRVDPIATASFSPRCDGTVDVALRNDGGTSDVIFRINGGPSITVEPDATPDPINVEPVDGDVVVTADGEPLAEYTWSVPDECDPVDITTRQTCEFVTVILTNLPGGPATTYVVTIDTTEVQGTLGVGQIVEIGPTRVTATSVVTIVIGDRPPVTLTGLLEGIEATPTTPAALPELGAAIATGHLAAGRLAASHALGTGNLAAAGNAVFTRIAAIAGHALAGPRAATAQLAAARCSLGADPAGNQLPVTGTGRLGLVGIVGATLLVGGAAVLLTLYLRRRRTG